MTMKHAKSVLLTLGYTLGSASLLAGGEATSITAAHFAVRMMTDRYQTYAELCASSFPDKRSDYSDAVERFVAVVQEVAKPLLASDAFISLTREPAPQDAARMLKDQKLSLQEEWKPAEAEIRCPTLVTGILHPSKDVLRAGITQYLTATQSMLVQMKQESK